MKCSSTTDPDSSLHGLEISDDYESVLRVLSRADELKSAGDSAALDSLADSVWDLYQEKGAASRESLLDLYLYLGLLAEGGPSDVDDLRTYRQGFVKDGPEGEHHD